MWVKVIDQDGHPVNHDERWGKDLVTIIIHLPKTHSDSMKEYHKSKNHIIQLNDKRGKKHE